MLSTYQLDSSYSVTGGHKAETIEVLSGLLLLPLGAIGVVKQTLGEHVKAGPAIERLIAC